MISMATLTGAARVAVGPDLAPYFSDDAGFVNALEAGAIHAQDPVWPAALLGAYEAMIEPGDCGSGQCAKRWVCGLYYGGALFAALCG